MIRQSFRSISRIPLLGGCWDFLCWPALGDAGRAGPEWPRSRRPGEQPVKHLSIIGYASARAACSTSLVGWTAVSGPSTARRVPASGRRPRSRLPASGRGRLPGQHGGGLHDARKRPSIASRRCTRSREAALLPAASPSKTLLSSNSGVTAKVVATANGAFTIWMLCLRHNGQLAQVLGSNVAAGKRVRLRAAQHRPPVVVLLSSGERIWRSAAGPTDRARRSGRGRPAGLTRSRDGRRGKAANAERDRRSHFIVDFWASPRRRRASAAIVGSGSVGGGLQLSGDPWLGYQARYAWPNASARWEGACDTQPHRRGTVDRLPGCAYSDTASRTWKV